MQSEFHRKWCHAEKAILKRQEEERSPYPRYMQIAKSEISENKIFKEAR